MENPPLIEPSLDSRISAMWEWLVELGLNGAEQEELLTNYCNHLVELGVPLARLHMSHRAFHPQYGGIGFSWERESGFSQENYERQVDPVAEWVQSPFYYILSTSATELHFDMSAPEFCCDFPFVNDLKQQGITEYFATGLRFEKGDLSTPVDPMASPAGMMISWASDGQNGFSERDLILIRNTLHPLGLALKSASNFQIGQDLLRVYLGRDAGRRVLSGEFQRGSLREIDAVIAYFDMTGFTSLAERIPGPDLIEMLNDYFAVVVAEVHRRGGNVLKFMGDGVLLMFDLEDRKASSIAAIDTVTDLTLKLAQTNQRRLAGGLPVADFTYAVHAGPIQYGNIGAPNRLDFTVIGPAVNLTARLSGMHRPLGQSIVISAEVHEAAQPCDTHDLVSLGRYMIRGVSRPQELYSVYLP